MQINKDLIQKLREQTGAGVMDVKRALEQAGGDETKIIEILREKAQKIAEKKQAEREAKQGIVKAYVHGNKKIGTLVQLACETDFVAKNEEFQQLAHDIAMQIAAMNPENTSDLLNQKFIKDDSKTINDLITEKIAKLGEKIEDKKMVRISF